MTKHYTYKHKGEILGYSFTFIEKHHIAEGLKTRQAKLQKAIEKVRNDKRNEGQAKYSIKIDEIQSEIDDLEIIIQEFLNP